MDETSHTPDDAIDEKTDIPSLPTWRAVYLVVVVVFIVYVVLLLALSRFFA